MQHPDEGTIHSWLDGALSADEAAQVESHVAECPECAAAVAEARGFIAGASRILTALDNAPRGVIPAEAPRKRVDPMVWRVAATLLVVAAGTLVVVRDRGTDKSMSELAGRVAVPQAKSPGPQVPMVLSEPAAVADERAAPAVAGGSKAATANALGLLRGKAEMRDSVSGVPERRNEMMEKRSAALPSQAPAALAFDQVVQQRPDSTRAPSHNGYLATGSARDAGPLKVIGTPRRIGMKVTLYEVGPGDTVTLTEPMTVALEQVVVTGVATSRMAPQAAGKSAAAPSIIQGEVVSGRTTMSDSSRTAGAPPPSTSGANARQLSSQADAANALHTITWVDSTTGRTLTLSGRIPEARLQEIRVRIERERAAAAAEAKKNPSP